MDDLEIIINADVQKNTSHHSKAFLCSLSCSEMYKWQVLQTKVQLSALLCYLG